MTVAEEISVGQFVKYAEEPCYLRVTGFYSKDHETLVICVDGWGQHAKLNPLEITDVRNDNEIDDHGNLIKEDEWQDS